MTEKPTIICDSREQKPYFFPDFQITVKGLKVGDYSIAGHEDSIAVERKSINDLISSRSSGRDRFARELCRGQDMNYFALIIEATLNDIVQGRYRSRMNPEAVIQSLLAFSVRYGMPVFFCGDRAGGQKITESLLLKYHREAAKRLKGA